MPKWQLHKRVKARGLHMVANWQLMPVGILVAYWWAQCRAGIGGIPAHWLQKLAYRSLLDQYAEQLYQLSQAVVD